MSALLLSLLVALLALISLTTATRPSLVSRLKQVQSPPASGSAPLDSLPLISGLAGCYYSTANQLQCPAGAELSIFLKPVSGNGVRVAIGSAYACADVRVNGSRPIVCTLPSIIQPDDFNTPFPVTVTQDGETSEPFGGVSFVQQPVLPTITSITGCMGGLNGEAAYACRENSRVTISGAGLYPTDRIVVSVGPYRTTAQYEQGVVTFYLPRFEAQDLGVLLPVTLTMGGYTATYTAGLSSYGFLRLDSISGCDTASGWTATNCEEGDVITLTGSAFNLGEQGDVNILHLDSTLSAALTWTMLSNTQILVIIPAAPSSGLSSFRLSLAAGEGPYRRTTGFMTVQWRPALIVFNTGGGLSGCRPFNHSIIPYCAAGDVLTAQLQGGDVNEVQAVTLLSPVSSITYDCSSVYTVNGKFACTVPQVDPVDLGQVLSVTATVAWRVSLPYKQGLVPLA